MHTVMCKIHVHARRQIVTNRMETFDISQQIICKAFVIVLSVQKHKDSDSYTSTKPLSTYRHSWRASDNFV